MRLVLRLGALHGHTLSDRYSRELLATVTTGLVARYATQQVAKLVPIVGWLAASGLAAASTWDIGRAATEYFRHGRALPLTRRAHLPRLPNVRGLLRRVKRDMLRT